MSTNAEAAARSGEADSLLYELGLNGDAHVPDASGASYQVVADLAALRSLAVTANLTISPGDPAASPARTSFYAPNAAKWGALPKRVQEAVAIISSAASESLTYIVDLRPVLPRTLMHAHSMKEIIAGIKLNLERVLSATVTNSNAELERITLGPDGDRLRLTPAMRATIHRRGECEIPSEESPGQPHVFRLNRGLQTGTENILAVWRERLGFAAGVVIHHARKALCNLDDHYPLGVLHALRILYDAVVNTLDLVIGVRDMIPTYSKDQMRQILLGYRATHRVAELVVRLACESDIVAPATLCPRCKTRLDTGKHVCTECEKVIDAELSERGALLEGPQGLLVDARLANTLLKEAVEFAVLNIQKRMNEDWYKNEADLQVQQLSSAIADHLGCLIVQDEQPGIHPDALGCMTRGQALRAWHDLDGAEQDSLSAKVLRACKLEKERRFLEQVAASPRIRELADGLGLTLVTMGRVEQALQQSLFENQVARRFEEHAFRDKIINSHRVLSSYTPWLNDVVNKHMTKFIAEHHLDVPNLEHVARLLDNAVQDDRIGSVRAAQYLIHRDLDFLQNQESQMHKRVKAVSHPGESVSLKRRIWRPEHWLVRLKQDGTFEIVSKYTCTQVPCTFIGWRLVAILVSMSTYLRNALFWLFVSAWLGPLSAQAMLRREKFYPDKAIHPTTGSLIPDTTDGTSTTYSMLKKLWSSIREERRSFECRTDSGILGKSVERQLFRLWHYVGRGTLGSLLIGVGHPILCVLNVLISVVLFVSAFIWVPLVSIAVHLINIFVTDWRSPFCSVEESFTGRSPRRLEYVSASMLPIFSILLFGYINGIARLVLSLAVGLVGAPILSLLTAAASTLFALLRSIWDAIMLASIIWPLGRQPAMDTWLARRIQGPGTSSLYHYETPPSVAIIMLHVLLETEELALLRAQYDELLDEPDRKFKQFVSTSLWPFFPGHVPVLSHPEIVASRKQQFKHLDVLFRERGDQMREMLESIRHVQKSGRWSAADPATTIRLARTLAARFVPYRILPRVGSSEACATYWAEKGITVGDYESLGRMLLCEIFGSEFLTPLKEIDRKLRLEVEHLNLSSYTDMISGKSERTGNLDCVTVPKLGTSEQSNDEWRLSEHIVTPEMILRQLERANSSSSEAAPVLYAFEHMPGDTFQEETQRHMSPLALRREAEQRQKEARTVPAHRAHELRTLAAEENG